MSPLTWHWDSVKVVVLKKAWIRTNEHLLRWKLLFGEGDSMQWLMLFRSVQQDCGTDLTKYFVCNNNIWFDSIIDNNVIYSRSSSSDSVSGSGPGISSVSSRLVVVVVVVVVLVVIGRSGSISWSGIIIVAVVVVVMLSIIIKNK